MDIKEQVYRFVIDEFLCGDRTYELQDSPNLIEEGIIGSLGVMRTLTFTEKTFRIRISYDELIPENFETIDAKSALIEVKTNQRQTLACSSSC